jgi:hypothetical protein
VRREDGDRPAEATGEREGDLAVAGAQLYAERWTRKARPSRCPVRGRWVVLFFFFFRAFFICQHCLSSSLIGMRGTTLDGDSERRRRNVPLLRGESHRRCTSPRRLASTLRFRRG